MKYTNLAVLALIGVVSARHAPSARRLDTTLLRFVDDEGENINLDDLDNELGHQGKFIEEEKFNSNELGGLVENGSYQAWRRAQKPELFDHDENGQLKDEYKEDNQYIGVRFVDYDENEANAYTQKALNVEKMGDHGFLVSGGAYSDPKEYTLSKHLSKDELEERMQERLALNQFDHVVKLNPNDESDGWEEE